MKGTPVHYVDTPEHQLFLWKQKVMIRVYDEYEIVSVPKLTLDALFEAGNSIEVATKRLGQWKDTPASGIVVEGESDPTL